MSYRDEDIGVASGAPVELYQLVLGAQRWTYTSSNQPVFHQNETYTPEAIRRSGIEHNTEIHRARLTITLPRDNPLASLFISAPPEGIVSFTLWRFHQHDALREIIVLWKGRVSSAQFAGSELTLQCDPIASRLKRLGLRARYSVLCRHALYSPSCGALSSAFAINARVEAIHGAVITVSTATVPPPGYFIAGRFQHQDGQRLIIAEQGNQLTLIAPVFSLTVGASVQLVAGCDHAMRTCQTRFNNLNNYGGFPFIPRKNPFSGDAII